MTGCREPRAPSCVLFWMVDALAMANRWDEAQRRFEYLSVYAMTLACSPRSTTAFTPDARQVPAGIGHLCLIDSAYNLQARAAAPPVTELPIRESGDRDPGGS